MTYRQLIAHLEMIGMSHDEVVADEKVEKPEKAKERADMSRKLNDDFRAYCAAGGDPKKYSLNTWIAQNGSR